MIYMAIGGTTLIYVFLRAFQQKNVMHNQYLWMIPVSYGMGMCDVYIIHSVASSENPLYLVALAMGTGGAVGAIAATFFHSKITGKTL